MILELLEYLATPCRWTVRRLGYLNGQLGLKLRHRQCRRAWADHLQQTRQFIRRALLECPQRRKAVVLGSGHGRDVPLADLAASFEQVVLVDVVHPLSMLLSPWRYRNVSLVCADVTATADELVHARNPAQPLPVSEPRLFLDDPTVDFVVSVNLLSQLPYVPSVFLGQTARPDEDVERYCRQLIEAHLVYLQKFPGIACLITDIEKLVEGPDAQIVERIDLMYGVPLPAPSREWIWNHVPRHHISDEFAYHRRVVAFTDVKQCGLPVNVQRDVA